MNKAERENIRRFRAYLNSLESTVNHKHNRYHQRKRPYGDYLYYQDRDKFMADLKLFLSPADSSSDSETN